MNSFVNREKEREFFLEHLNNLLAQNYPPPVLLIYGISGMGKTWLLKKMLLDAEQHSKSPFVIYLDCNRTDMTIEKLFNDIHTSLEEHYKKDFDTYTKFLDDIEKIEQTFENEISTNQKNAEQLNNLIAKISAKAITSIVPGTAVADNLIEGGTRLASSYVQDGIAKFRTKLLKNKLDQDHVRLFLKDIQSEQAKKLTRILNEICIKYNRKIILFVDCIEKLAQTPNTKSDKTFYEYWKEDFLRNLSDDIFVIQTSRSDYYNDFQSTLYNKTVESFELKKFEMKQIREILSIDKELKDKINNYEVFLKTVFELTKGYPVAIGLFRNRFRSLTDYRDFETLIKEISDKKMDIIRYSINWLLDKNTDIYDKDTIYKLAICCSCSGKIDKEALQFILKKSDMSPAQVEEEISKLASKYSFIDAINDTMHEIAREFILRYLKVKYSTYLRKINKELLAYHISYIVNENH